MKKDPWALFKPISDAASCQKTIKDVSIGFYVLAGLQGAIGVILMPSMILDAVIIALLAALIHTLKSRIAAVLLLLLTGVMLVTTVLTALGISQFGGKNLWLAVFAVWCGVKGVEATFKYHFKYKNAESGPRE